MKPGDKDAVLADLHAFRTLMRELGCGDQRTSYDEAGLSSDAPDDDSIGLVTVNIGERGSLSKQRVRTGARAWHETTQRYPQAALLIYVLGYDQDPRELWEIPEAARYVRWWARYAGMDDYGTADRLVGSGSPMREADQFLGLGLLAACGVFGDQRRQQAIAAYLAQRPCASPMNDDE